MTLQRPLLRKNPPTTRNVPKTSDAARMLAHKAQTILELSVSDKKITYRNFLVQFSKCTKTDFEMELRKIQQVEPGFSLDNLVDLLSFFGHRCTLQRGIREDVFVFTPFPANVQQIVIPPRATRVSVRDPVPVATRSSIKSVPESSQPANEKSALAAAPLSSVLETLKKHQDYSKKMFRKPSWPWLAEERREKNREVFLQFLQITEDGSLNRKQVFYEAKQLAIKFWQSTVPNIPHVLYMLHLLGKNNPNGVEFFNLHTELDKVLPDTWREINASSEDIISEPSLLILMNLIIPSGSNGSGMVEVNQLINYVGFHEIWDREISMLYFFIGSTPDSKSSESVHEFMVENFPKWSKNYDKKTGTDRVNKICLENDKMFRTENNRHTTRPHLYKIGVPMFFTSSPVISPSDS